MVKNYSSNEPIAQLEGGQCLNQKVAGLSRVTIKTIYAIQPMHKFN